MRAADGLTVGDIVNDNAVRFGDVIAYRHGACAVTHGQLRERAVQLVSAMSAVGVRRQDRIAVLSRNSIEFGDLVAATHISVIIMANNNFRLSHRRWLTYCAAWHLRSCSSPKSSRR